MFEITKQYDNIITNPPFGQQQLVKKHLLPLVKKKLALLWYVKNLGNEIETKTSKNLKCVYVFNKRIEWIEIKLGWLFAWYIWEKDYEVGVYMLPKELDEEVARLHLDKIGVKLTKLSKEQSDYVGIPENGPYKSEHYRY